MLHRFENSASLLKSANSDDQIGPFENFHQLIQDTLVVLRPGLKVFFQDALRFANRLKSQLLISHCFSPHAKCAASARRQGKSSRFWGYPINFCFGLEA
jgi:hypothetical protein